VKTPRWESIYQSTEEYSVRIKKLALDDAGIPNMIFDQRDSSYNAFGYIYLQVMIEDVERANEILNSSDE